MKIWINTNRSIYQHYILFVLCSPIDCFKWQILKCYALWSLFSMQIVNTDILQDIKNRTSNIKSALNKMSRTFFHFFYCIFFGAYADIYSPTIWPLTVSLSLGLNLFRSSLWSVEKDITKEKRKQKRERQEGSSLSAKYILSMSCIFLSRCHWISVPPRIWICSNSNNYAKSTNVCKSL